MTDIPPLVATSPPANPHLPAMIKWRRLTAGSLLQTLVGLLLLPWLPVLSLPVVIPGATVFLLAAVLSLYQMTRAAWTEVGPGYALRQLLLALLLLPPLGLGVFVVTRLVESDLFKWQPAEESMATNPSTPAG